MNFNRYFEEELTFLKNLGPEFGRRWPELAPFLGSDDPNDPAFSRDPDVDRLFEGFAFLTGRIRQKLDDEFPELIDTLLSVLAPDLLRPQPSATIIEFEPMQGRVRGATEIPAREVELGAKLGNGAECRFQTCWPVEVLPLSLQDVASKVLTDGGLELRLNLVWYDKASPPDLDRLRFHLSGKGAADLYLWFCEHLVRCALTGAEVDRSIRLPKPTPLGFVPGEALVLQTAPFDGARLLQEYFAFKAKFLFVEFSGLKALQKLGRPKEFALYLRFRDIPAHQFDLSPANFRLFCCPAVNMFPADSDPIAVTGERYEYPVQAADSDLSIHSIQSGQGWLAGTREPRDYEPFVSLSRKPDTTYYDIKFRRHIVTEEPQAFVSFVTPRQKELVASRETVVFSLLCTNGSAAQTVKEGQIHDQTSTSPEYARFRNISPISPYVPVPTSAERRWQLLSHMVLSPTALNDVDRLASMLRMYNIPITADPPVARANIRRIESISAMRVAPADFMMTSELDPGGFRVGGYGVSVRGTSVELDMDGEQFASEGDLFLFGSVLNHVFGYCATLNSATRLTVKNTATGTVHRWTPHVGSQPAL
ncbi:MAG: type VI secretion system baseplate subunit TssF [Acidobacteriaceae bacterium]|nr:type VI secretion system baseplate subunit TssF [Acidobacteriaceae bacterium]MBV9296410.1 type VI secretion system baseplate subunit TssF [Acidobacteriaceae bacterium]MBV9764378.1 type VI secretion system baseplate subunit TssF [Acidobacteriaceae bacterium]